MSTIQNYNEHWSNVAASVLLGRKIVAVRYLDEDEADRLGWCSRSVVFKLDNGHWVWASRDDEGNDAGALFTTDSRATILPVLQEV